MTWDKKIIKALKEEELTRKELAKRLNTTLNNINRVIIKLLYVDREIEEVPEGDKRIGLTLRLRDKEFKRKFIRN